MSTRFYPKPIYGRVTRPNVKQPTFAETKQLGSYLEPAFPRFGNSLKTLNPKEMGKSLYAGANDLVTNPEQFASDIGTNLSNYGKTQYNKWVEKPVQQFKSAAKDLVSGLSDMSAPMKIFGEEAAKQTAEAASQMTADALGKAATDTTARSLGQTALANALGLGAADAAAELGRSATESAASGSSGGSGIPWGAVSSMAMNTKEVTDFMDNTSLDPRFKSQLGSTVQGAVEGGSVGGPIGAIIGAVVGLGKGTQDYYQNISKRFMEDDNYLDNTPKWGEMKRRGLFS